MIIKHTFQEINFLEIEITFKNHQKNTVDSCSRHDNVPLAHSSNHIYHWHINVDRDA